MIHSTFKERQNEEVEVLKAIFMEDFVDRTPAGRGKNKNEEFCLKLTPLQSIVGKDVHARVDLLVKFTSKYPENPPVIRFENAKGFSDESLETLKRELDQMADSSVGEVMILQLAQHVQAFLHRHNVPRVSLHEQMVTHNLTKEQMVMTERMKMKEEIAALTRERDEDVMRQVKEEMQRREEAVLRTKRQRHASESMNVGDEDFIEDMLSCPDEQGESGLLQGSQMPYAVKEDKCWRGLQHKKVFTVEFQVKGQSTSVICGGCQGHYEDHLCHFACLDILSGKSLTVHECISPISNNIHGTTDSLLRQVNSIEQEMLFLISKLHHRHLINYRSIRIDQSQHDITIKVLTDAIQGVPLSDMYNDQTVSMDQIADFNRQLVDILFYLHSKGVYHRNLKTGNIFYDSSGGVLRLVGCSIWRRLADLNVARKNVIEDSYEVFRKYVKPGKKADVFNLGLVIYSLSIGQFKSTFPVYLPDTIPDPLRDFLNCCLEPDERDRWTIAQLMKHPFVSQSIPQQLTPKKNLIDVGRVQSIDSVKQPSHPLSIDQPYSQLPFQSGIVFLSKSRLNNEFEVLHWLGQGGFGNVIKVQNKLDGCIYAIKRIPLDPRNPNLTKKITREVKLLSRLNHEHVVRYYNSWVEVDDTIDDSATTATTATTSNDNCHGDKNIAKDKTNFSSQSFKAPPSMRDDSSLAKEESWADDNPMATNSREEGIFRRREECDSSSDESSSYYRNPRPSPTRSNNLSSKRINEFVDSSDCSVMFAVDNSEVQFGDALDTEDESEDDAVMPNKPQATTKATARTTETTSDSSRMSSSPQYLFIQMEYCERSTLRNAIDDGLAWEPERKWRLIREIVEGLTHVHSQGMIHRDLKPDNIFLDSRDQVKIGDFGLATSHASSNKHSFEGFDSSSLLKSSTSPDTPIDSNMTGKVGTALYVAPELGYAASRVKFSPKVDLYSLGIILFEMCHRPWETRMERVQVIANLRKQTVELPPEFESESRSRERHLVRWLLSHDPEVRPSSRELLESGYIPPKIEDRQFDELLRHTLSQSNSSKYLRMMAALFNQTESPVTEVMYDLHRHGNNELAICHSARALRHVERTLESVFIRHGATAVNTPFLSPKSVGTPSPNNMVTLMDAGGMLLCLPYDSRHNFARFIALNDISRMRRYCLGRVYRSDGYREHPKEIAECTFDIVGTPSSNMIMEAEVIYTIWEIIREFPSLEDQRKFYVRLNHSKLIKAILLHSCVPEEHHVTVVEILQTRKTVSERQNSLKRLLSKLNIQESTRARLCSYFDFEDSLPRAREVLQSLRKTKESVSSIARQALLEIETLIKTLRMFDQSIMTVVSPSLAYPSGQSSGIVFQVVANNNRKRNRGGVDILAMGGRFDLLIKECARFSDRETALPCSVGMTLAVDKLVSHVMRVASETRQEELPRALTDVDVIVCSLGDSPLLEEMLLMLRDLWNAGIRSALSSYEKYKDLSLEELQDYCRENCIQHMVLLKESDADVIRIRTQEKEKYSEARIPRKDVCDYLQQRILGRQDPEKGTSSSSTTIQQSSDQSFTLQIAFLPPDKLQTNIRRRLEGKLQSSLSPMITQIAQRTPCEVLGVDLPRSDMDLLASSLDLMTADNETFNQSIDDIISTSISKGKYIQRICLLLRSMQTEKNIVMVYSYTCEYYRLFL